jgi:exonuclease III
MKLLMWNVQGIQTRGYFTDENQLTNQESDIVIVTETNLLPSQKIFPSLLSRNSDHQCICSLSQQRETAVLILLNSNCKLVGCPLIDPNGRYIAMSICFQKKLKLNILAVYGPAKASLRDSWCNELFTLELPFESVDIFAGDFNLITNSNDTDSPHFISSSTIDFFNNFLN